jgi:hypothetical protein
MRVLRLASKSVVCACNTSVLLSGVPDALHWSVSTSGPKLFSDDNAEHSWKWMVQSGKLFDDDSAQ